MNGTQILLMCFVAIGALIAALILLYAAAEVTLLQRIMLGAMPFSVATLIAWLAWPDGKPAPAPVE